MKGFVGVMYNDWFAFLSQQPGINEVNFWQPSGTSQVRGRHWFCYSNCARGGLIERNAKGRLIIGGALNLGGSVELIPNPVAVGELAAEKGTTTLLRFLAISCG